MTMMQRPVPARAPAASWAPMPVGIGEDLPHYAIFLIFVTGLSATPPFSSDTVTLAALPGGGLLLGDLCAPGEQ